MNLLLLSIDCLRYDYVTPEITPNLWKLKERGLWFEQAISCGSCTPTSFYSVFSGEYVNEDVRVKDETHPKVFNMKKSFVEEFQKAGYSTKALFSNPLMKIGGKYGFDRGFDDYEYLDPLSNKIPYVLGEDMTNFALDWITGQDDKWLLWLHYMDAHPPFLYTHEQKWINDKTAFDPFLQQKIHDSANYEDPEILPDEHESIIKAYIRELQYVDAELPKLLENLEDYFLVLWADHGYQFGEHGRYYMGDVLYDELIHVPYLLYNSQLNFKRVIETAYSLIHLSDDVLERFFPCRLANPRLTTCSSVAMRDRAGRKYWMKSVRTDRYKIITIDEGGWTNYEFYDLVKDPREQENVEFARVEVEDDE